MSAHRTRDKFGNTTESTHENLIHLNTFTGRIFIGPVNVAGMASRLSEGFRQCGVKSEIVLAWPDHFQYTNKHSGYFAILQWVGRQRQLSSSTNVLKKVAFVVLHKLLGFGLLPWALIRFDAFIFFFAQTITNTSIELKLLKLFQKRIIFVYAGSDVRPPFMDGGLFPEGGPIPSASQLRKLTQRKKLAVKLHEKFADFIVNSPFCGQFHEKSFVNWFAMGVPFTSAKAASMPDHKTHLDLPHVRILHSPSNPAVKGTPQILTMLDELKAKGLKFELKLLQQLSNDQVIDEIQECDFVIDQLYSDTPMAVFATEAAQFGKPAIVGSYASHADDSLFSIHGRPPSLFVSPEEFKNAIETMIVDREKRERLGTAAATFVKEKWDYREVARRYLKLLNGDCDPNWLVDPKDVCYAMGCGLSKERTAKLTFDILKEFGDQSLCLDDKPNLLTSIKLNAEVHSRSFNA